MYFAHSSDDVSYKTCSVLILVPSLHSNVKFTGMWATCLHNLSVIRIYSFICAFFLVFKLSFVTWLVGFGIINVRKSVEKNRIKGVSNDINIRHSVIGMQAKEFRYRHISIGI
jgi:hypothetical protein